MAKGIIEPKLAETPRAKPDFLRVTTRTIVFRPSFVEQALSRFLRAVKDRLEIFREGVNDVDILGKKAGDCIGNWLA